MFCIHSRNLYPFPKNILRLPFLALICISALAASKELDDEAERQNVISACTGCHSLDYYITPRSRKAWELTVANMRAYIQNGTSTFTDEQGERVVEYLATYFHEESSLDAAKHFAPSSPDAPPPVTPVPLVTDKPAATVQDRPVSNVVAVPPPVQIAAVTAPRVLPPAIRERLAHPRWKPSHPVKHLAEYSGYLAVFCTVVMFLSGHNRRRLARRFRPIHIFSALGLFLSLATHAIIYIFQYGNPPVLWYWFGIVSFLLLVLAQLQGIIRKRFGRIFLNIHVTAGYCGLTLAILHWIWAWL
jgi:cytochrome c553